MHVVGFGSKDVVAACQGLAVAVGIGDGETDIERASLVIDDARRVLQR